MDGVAKKWGVQHHFVTAYCPWANGTVEVVNRVFLRAIKSMLSERKLPLNQWSGMVPMVQASINFQPSSRLTGIAPVTAFAGLKAKPPIALFYQEQQRELPIQSDDQINKEVNLSIIELSSVLEKMHRAVVTSSKKKNQQQRDYIGQKKSTKGLFKLEIGDFVLVGNAQKQGHKLALQWKGPCRVISIQSDWIYEVQTLFQPIKTSLHHIARLKLYAEKNYELVEDLVAQAIYNQETFQVESLLKYRREGGKWYVQVQWSGFDANEATWEPLDNLLQDVPDIVMATLKDRQWIKSAGDNSVGYQNYVEQWMNRHSTIKRGREVMDMRYPNPVRNKKSIPKAVEEMQQNRIPLAKEEMQKNETGGEEQANPRRRR